MTAPGTVPDVEVKWWMWPFGCGFWLLVLAALASVVPVLQARGFDPDRRCPPHERGRCISVERGTVVSADRSTQSVVLRLESGADDVGVAGPDLPDPGSRVRAERWDDRVIAFRDARGRRFETTGHPPVRAAKVGRIAIVVALAVVVAILANGAVQFGRFYAARSNGKPWRSRSRSKSRR